MINSEKPHPGSPVNITPDEIIKKVYDYLEGLHLFDAILITRAGGVISSHCGYATPRKHKVFSRLALNSYNRK